MSAVNAGGYQPVSENTGPRGHTCQTSTCASRQPRLESLVLVSVWGEVEISADESADVPRAFDECGQNCCDAVSTRRRPAGVAATTVWGV